MKKSWIFAFWIQFVLAPCAFADGAQLIKPSDLVGGQQEITSLSTVELSRLGKIRSRPETIRATAARINKSAFLSTAVNLSMPDGTTLSLLKIKETKIGPTEISWSGKTTNKGDFTVVSQDNEISGVIRDGGRIYEIEPLGNNYHVLIEIDTTRLPPEHTESASSGIHPVSLRLFGGQRTGRAPNSSLSDGATATATAAAVGATSINAAGPCSVPAL